MSVVRHPVSVVRCPLADAGSSLAEAELGIGVATRSDGPDSGWGDEGDAITAGASGHTREVAERADWVDGGTGDAKERRVERRRGENVLDNIAPISSEGVKTCISPHVPDLPRS